jgi:hypothetical protein
VASDLFPQFPTMLRRFSLHDMNMLWRRKKLFQTLLTTSDYVTPVVSGAQREYIKYK